MLRQLDQESPFFKADLYKKYFTLDYRQILTGEEKSWLEEHGDMKNLRVCWQNIPLMPKTVWGIGH